MVQKNNKWNISKEKGEKIAHKYMIELLRDSKHNTLPLSELIILLNQRTKHINISYHTKRKPMSTYLKSMYGKMINFIDNYSFYGVIKNGADIKIKLFEGEFNLTSNILQEYTEWIFVDEEEFILV